MVISFSGFSPIEVYLKIEAPDQDDG